MKALHYAIVAMILPVVASATNFKLKSGVTDWSSVDSYTVDGAPATSLPGANDVIILPAETFTLAASDAKFAASIGQINAVKQVSISKNAKLIVDVGTSDVTITCKELSTYTGNDALLYTGNGVIEKRGSGSLSFATTSSSHVANLTVSEGTVFAYSDGSLYFGGLEVALGASFRPGKVNAGCFPVFRGPITGAGSISSVDGATKNVVLCTYWSEPVSETFSGTISGKVSFSVRCGSTLNLAGVDNTFTEGVGVGGRVAATKIGKKADVASSLGTKTSVSFGYVESGVFYSGSLGYVGLGTDETDRLFSFVYSPTPNVIDGGANGSLVLANVWDGDAKKADYPSQQRVVLTGEGSNVMRGQINDIVTDNGTYSFYVTKKGTGIWTIEENASSKMAGVWAAEEGTLKFGSFAPLGQFCALGFSTNLYDNVWGAANMTEANRVDYAFLLGGTNAAAPGAMEYSGTDYLVNTTRKIAVKGTGRLTATTAQTAYADVISAKSGETATLVLDGPSGATNDLAGVTDGGGTLGLVKSGAGTWRLAGDNSFSGPVAVTGGTLIVSSPDTTKYSYYRLTIKETYGVKNGLVPTKVADQETCSFTEFALYNADGYPISADLVGAATPIAQGAATYFLHNADAIANASDAYMLFDFANSYPGLSYSDGRGMPDHTKSSTWMTFVLHLANDVASAAYFDLATSFGTDYKDNKAAMNPTAWTIEASCDGYTWEPVNEEDDATTFVPSANLSYYSDGAAVGTRKRKRVTSFPAAFTLDRTVPAKTVFKPFGNATSVRVDAGAKLVKEGPGSVSVNELSIDKARGLGTLSGFTFAANSTLSVDGVTKSDAEINLPGTLDVVGLENVSWTLKVNGAVSTKYDFTVTSAGVRLVKRGGLVLIFR